VNILSVSVYDLGINRLKGSVAGNLDISGKTVDISEGVLPCLIIGNTKLAAFGVSNSESS
jgi:hypothetical protein